MANTTGIRDIEMIQKITNMNLENQNKQKQEGKIWQQQK